MRIVVPAAAAATALALATVAPASAGWLEPFDAARPINFAIDRSADAMTLADVGGRPTLAWTEDSTQAGAGNSSAVHVARLGAAGTSWDQLEGDISRVSTASSSNPSVADVGGQPWVAWAENHDGPADAQIRVARPSNGGGWQRVDDSDRPINQGGVGHADNPVIADGPDRRPYVVFWEVVAGTGSILAPDFAAPAKVWVVRLSTDRTRWERVGDTAVSPPAVPGNDPGLKDALFPDIAVIDGRVWISYLQVIRQQDGGNAAEVRAARLSDDGGSWERVEALVPPAGFQADFRQPDIAAVSGRPMVAVGLQGDNAARVLAVRPRADRSGWDEVAGGFASPANVRASNPSLAEIDGTPWVAWSEGGSGGAARLVQEAWVPAGGPITGPRGNFNGLPRLAAVGGLPWVAFGVDDGSRPGSPGCCQQARVARLAPDFGAASVYPASTTAAVLASVQTFGLDYQLGLEVTPLGALPLTTPLKTLDPSQALAELRGLQPATPHSFRPFATAGTPVRVFGPTGQFVTPPAPEQAPATNVVATTPAPSVVAQTRPAIVLGILRAPTRLRLGTTLRLHVLSSEGGQAELVARRNGSVVRRISRTVAPGRWNLTWKPARVPRGSYRLTVSVRTSDGRVATDSITVRMVRR